MSRQVKCPICEQKLSKEDAYEYKKKYYHTECFNAWKQESEDRKSLIDYICELYKMEAPTGMILKQIKEFHEEFKFKYKGMELALRYFHETLGNPVQEGAGIGIIPFIYEEAKRHYIMKMKVMESVQSAKIEEVQVIEVESPKVTYRRKVKPIDISSL